MPKGNNQRLKLYYLAQIMLEKTDSEHGITMDEIISALEEHEVSAERKSIYGNMKDLADLGIEISKVRVGNETYYNVVERPFEITELKLLVDSIQSSRFISEKRSDELIKKLSGFASKYEAGRLSRQVFVKNRPKTANDKSYYNVDLIHEAIAANRKISFKYFNWDVNKQKVYRDRDYAVSPWALAWQDDNYYLVAYDAEKDIVRNFRVDKIEMVQVVDESRDGADKYKEFNLPVYLNRSFRMFGGEVCNVKLRIKNEAAGIFIDRFGSEISFRPDGDGFSTFYVDVMISNQFYAWVFALGDKVQIIAPQNVVDGAKEFIKRLGDIYK